MYVFFPLKITQTNKKKKKQQQQQQQQKEEFSRSK